MSDRMPEDLPVTKRIDVMVGITRSKVIFWGGSSPFSAKPSITHLGFHSLAHLPSLAHFTTKFHSLAHLPVQGTGEQGKEQGGGTGGVAIGNKGGEVAIPVLREPWNLR